MDRLSALRVVMADDHGLVRGVLREHLVRRQLFDVVAAVGDADAALGAALAHTPDVVVLDVEMPGRSPFEVARLIGSALPRTAVMFLSSYFQDRYIEQAVAAGARGYVVKTSTPEQFIEAIRQVAQGGVAFSAEVMDRLVIDHSGVRLTGGLSTKLSQLSDREIEVVRYLATGLSKKEIAGNMHLSVKTVQNHADRLMQKLGIHDRVALARFAIREKIVSP